MPIQDPGKVFDIDNHTITAQRLVHPMEHILKNAPRPSGPRHLEFRELVLVLLFPLIAPYWIAAMIGRRRWRATCEAFGATIAGIACHWAVFLTWVELPESTGDGDLMIFLMLGLAFLAYVLGGVAFWSTARRPLPTWLRGCRIPGLNRWWGAGFLATLAVAATVVWYTGQPQFLAWAIHDAIWMTSRYAPDMSVFYEIAIDMPIKATFNMSGQQAWLATLVWLTVTAGPAIITIRAYRVEETKRLQTI
jgi:hypothetical protein